MKIKLPLVLRSTYERLVKDVIVAECTKDTAESKVRKLKSELQMTKDNAYIKEHKQNKEIEKLKLELEKKYKQLQGMEWCIQERDKELVKIKAFNMELYKKVELSSEMYRQFKDKVDKACEIELVTRTITPADIKKFMKVEDIIQLYTLIGIAGK
ncbi:hypothetical protein LZ906_006630 [Paraclostridium ghonii]|uniref:hypothetical protein n=1 Tax=Paraclostridium ghonii TaxID=29358 RepID=UPI00202CC893|nr:hypothetical protein [Paeniclostridium ghonii]MCM0167056.1 hypothetical protein [Paeniclostridium ghonii]